MPEINGKSVTFKSELTNREGWDCSPVMAALAEAAQNGASVKALFYAVTYDDALRLMSTLIESWEFEGDPADVKSYEALDLYTELVPMFTEAIQEMGAQAQRRQDLGESVSEST
jgi:hypothetical protein